MSTFNFPLICGSRITCEQVKAKLNTAKIEASLTKNANNNYSTVRVAQKSAKEAIKIMRDTIK